MRRFVITGAPGAGKTAILQVLRRRGYAVVDEAATDVIAAEQARGVDESGRPADERLGSRRPGQPANISRFGSRAVPKVATGLASQTPRCVRREP